MVYNHETVLLNTVDLLNKRISDIKKELNKTEVHHFQQELIIKLSELEYILNKIELMEASI